MKNISIKWKILTIVLSTVILITSILTIQSIISIEKLSEENISAYRKEAYDNKKAELKNYVNIAAKSIESYYKRTAKDKIQTEVEAELKEKMNFLFSIIEKQYQRYKGKVSQKDLKKIILDTVKDTRYGKNGYFWINDFEPLIIMHPFKQNLVGKSKKGVKHWDQFVQQGKQGDGFVSYIQNLNGKNLSKVSYVKTFTPFNWIIGTGAYVDDITSHLKNEALEAVKHMRYGKSGYFWINDKDSIMIMHPIKDSLIGTDFKKVKDKKGYVWIPDGTKQAQEKGGAFITYYWPKPGLEGPQPKLSYMHHFKDWNWIIGTGAYVDDIENKIRIMKQSANDEINSMIIQTIIESIILIIIVILLVAAISTKYIVKPMEKFQEGLLGFFKYLNRESSNVELLDDNFNDEIGEMSKVVNTNILKSKSGIEEDKRVIADTINVLAEFEQGDLCQRVKTSSSNPALKELTNLLNQMGDNMESNIDNVLNILEQYSNYNYINKVDTANIKEHLFKLANGVNLLGDSITAMLVENKSNGLTLQESSQILLGNVDTLNSSSNEAAASLEETAAALEQITSNISNNTNNIVQMANHANEVTSSVTKGQDLANQTTQAMEEINREVTEINDAITVIDQIAFQTNILSLNAAVEAATAGEAGKGFAVVAQEVRNLASRSAEAANEIKNLVENATNKASNGKKIADEMIEGYTHLNQSILHTIELISDVEMASKEQLSGIEQINTAVSLLDQQTQKNASVANTTKDISEQTQSIANTVVQNADEKEFNGKNSIKAKDLSRSNYTKKEIVQKPVAATKPQINSNNKTLRTVTADKTTDDEWASF